LGKCAEDVHVSLMLAKSSGYFTKYQYTFLILSRLVLFRNQTTLMKKIKTHFICSYYFLLQKPCHWWVIMEKFSTARQLTHARVQHMHFILNS